MPLQRAEYGLASDLLPPRPGLLVAHYEILIVDSGQVKVKRSVINRRLPHQTGVAERSVSRNQRNTSDRVLHHVMVAHLPNRKSRGVAVHVYCKDFVGVGNKTRVASPDKGRVRQRIEHPFEMILPCEPGGSQRKA